MPWSVHETPWDFGHELLPEDIDRIAPSLEVGFEHFPAFQTAGIKQIVNGARSRSRRTATRSSARSGVSTGSGSRAG